MKEQVLKQSQAFWAGLEKADTAAMRAVCDEQCYFVHSKGPAGGGGITRKGSG